jgi:hypothetical protein
MLTRLLASLICLGVAGAAAPSLSAQSDLDAFMEKVLARRDDNWKKLQQYVLDEKEAFDLIGPGGLPLFGMRRDYTWFVRQGIFVRSPVRANGVELSEETRRKEEDEWLRRQQRREERAKRRAEREAKGEPPEPDSGGSISITPTDVIVEPGDGPPSNVEDVLRQGMEPQFVSSAYFLKFKFESGHYALAGRETIHDVPTLKIEYYPEAGLFKDGRSKPDRRVREKEDQIESKMNKASMVTLWIDPRTHQILQYVFDDLDWDFFPGRALVRIGDVQAMMQMGQAFPGIWLPKSIEMSFEMTLAVGTVDATYRVDYLNYKEAAVTYKIK